MSSRGGSWLMAVVAIAGAVTAGCGPGAEAGGGTAGSSAASGGAGGAGAGGGGAPACTSLSLVGAPRVVEVPANAQAGAPALATSPVGKEAWVVYRLDTGGPLRNLSQPLYAVKLDTSSWPADPIGPSTLLDAPPSTSFAVASWRHFSGGDFDLVYSGTPASLVYVPEYSVDYGAGWGTAPVGKGLMPRTLFASTFAFTLIGYRIRETINTPFELSSVRMARGRFSRFGVDVYWDRLLGCVDLA